MKHYIIDFDEEGKRIISKETANGVVPLTEQETKEFLSELKGLSLQYTKIDLNYKGDDE